VEVARALPPEIVRRLSIPESNVFTQSEDSLTSWRISNGNGASSEQPAAAAAEQNFEIQELLAGILEQREAEIQELKSHNLQLQSDAVQTQDSLEAEIQELKSHSLQLQSDAVQAQDSLEAEIQELKSHNLQLQSDAVQAQDVFALKKAKLEEENATLLSDIMNQQKKQQADKEHAQHVESDLRAELARAQETSREASEEVVRLRDELAQARMEAQHANSVIPQEPVSSEGSEGRLRRVMTTHNVPTDELRSAVTSVEALVQEARRELERKEHREKRAAYEQLLAAIDKAEETLLEVALVVARKVELDAVDIAKGEKKLEELRSMSDEQKNARVARELEGKRRKEAFLLVKKDDASLMEAFLNGLESDVPWMNWRDYAGRTVYKCAQDLKSERVQSVLAVRLGLEAPRTARVSLGSWRADGERKRSATMTDIISRRNTVTEGSTVADAVDAATDSGDASPSRVRFDTSVSFSQASESPPRPRLSLVRRSSSGIGRLDEQQRTVSFTRSRVDSEHSAAETVSLRSSRRFETFDTGRPRVDSEAGRMRSDTFEEEDGARGRLDSVASWWAGDSFWVGNFAKEVEDVAEAVALRKKTLEETESPATKTERKHSLFDAIPISLAKPEEESCKPCPANCGYQVTWHATHCCQACFNNPGRHGGQCDRIPEIDQTEEAEVMPALSEEDELKLKTAALRCVVKNDGDSLIEMLEGVPQSVWSAWQNRAGKDLITLAEERGSSDAHSALMKCMGLVQDMERDVFEERENVWVYLPGDVQPRRATVLEDTPEEVDEVLIEYWDGDDPPSRIDRAMIRKDYAY